MSQELGCITMQRVFCLVGKIKKKKIDEELDEKNGKWKSKFEVKLTEEGW